MFKIPHRLCSTLISIRSLRRTEGYPPGIVSCGLLLALVLGITGAAWNMLAFAAELSTAAAATEELAAAAQGVERIVAHRGAMLDRPENTIAAIERAIEAGATAVEIDIRTSHDGTLVLMHDAKVDRTTSGTGRVNDLSWAELAALDAGSWFGPEYAGQRVPSLGQVLKVCRGRIDVQLDLKEDGEAYADRIAACVKADGEPARMVVAVRSVEQARQIKKRLPEVSTLIFLRAKKDLEPFLDAKVDFLRPQIAWIEKDPDLLTRIRDGGAKIHLDATAGTLKKVSPLLRYHPESLLCDDPAQLVQTLAALVVRSPDMETDMETVKIATERTGFVLSPSGERFVPWGHNYASVDIMERLANDPQRVEREFAEMKAAGTTVARIHPEMPRFLTGPGEVAAPALSQLQRLLEIAEDSGIRLMITGLACYKIDERMAWYDSMDEQERWKTQAFFWETIARACAESPAVFAYDLINEPGAVGDPKEGWYLGRMGDVEFCQRLSLDAGTRSGDDIFRQWTTLMVSAIHQYDQTHLITMGMLPFPAANKAAAEQLDFVSPHLYPKSGKVDAEIELLKKFDWGKPIVIGETFPLSCGVDDERDFLLKSRPFAQGWIGHWPDESPERLAQLEETGKGTIHSAIWLSWVNLFKELGPQMTGKTEP